MDSIYLNIHKTIQPLVMSKILLLLIGISVYSILQGQLHMAEIKADGIVVPVVIHTAVNNPDEGQMVFDPSTNSYWYWDGGAWFDIGNNSRIIDEDRDTYVEAGEDFIDFAVLNNANSSMFLTDDRLRMDFSSAMGGANLHIGQTTINPTFSTGSRNTFLGFSTGEQNTTGSDNTYVGTDAGQFSTTGSENIFIGAFSGIANTTGNKSVLIGHSAGNVDTNGEENTMVGYYSGRNSGGMKNTFIGTSSGEYAVTNSSVIIGDFAGHKSTGDNTILIGAGAGNDNKGAGSILIGTGAGRTNTDKDLVAIGNGAGEINVGDGNTFVGQNSGNNNSMGKQNTYVGSNTGQSNISGVDNTLIGFVAGSKVTGVENTFIGSLAGNEAANGDRNVYIGKATGLNNDGGSSNVFIGTDVGRSFTMASPASDRLMIDNSDDAIPLIYGEFDNEIVKISRLFKLEPFDVMNATPPTCDHATNPENTGMMFMDESPLSGLSPQPARLMFCDGTTYVPLN